ncbi:MAG TPA: DUF308 domain-containing protein [Actinomycetota bacterium]|nr:DUF308 domain-containing protein [Actinomycetota bacterium]
MVERQADARSAAASAPPWWLFLITGIAWFLIALIVLRFDISSITAVGVLLGCLFLFAGVNEAMAGAVVDSWKWLHYVMAVIFFVGSLYAFIHPQNAFWALASILGFLLLFKGTLDIMVAVATKHENDVWWLGLTAGILEILLAFWASQQYFPARAALILLWVGFMALFRGFSEIALAFGMRHAQKQ